MCNEARLLLRVSVFWWKLNTYIPHACLVPLPLFRFYPSAFRAEGVLSSPVSVCLSVCLSVRLSVRLSVCLSGCKDFVCAITFVLSDPRVTKFGTNVYLGKCILGIEYGFNQPWRSGWFGTLTDKRAPKWACPHDNSQSFWPRVTKFGTNMHLGIL